MDREEYSQRKKSLSDAEDKLNQLKMGIKKQGIRVNNRA